MAFPAYTKPDVVTRNDTRVSDWELKSFAQPAPTYNQFDPPPPSPDSKVPLGNGVLMASSWTQATAWFVNVAHAPGAPAQWMLTAAHNFVNMVPKHDAKGVITDFGHDEPAFADAVYIVAGWGPTAVGAYATRVSIMKGYSDDVVHNIHLDGAALHIPTATISAAFWNQAPQIACLPRAPAPPRSRRQLHPLQGMYLAGDHANAGTTIHDFRPVIVTRTRDATQTGTPNHLQDITLQYNEAVVYTAQGVSGSPMVVLAANTATILGSLNTSGIVAGFTQAAPAVELEAVDPAALLMAVYSPRMVWQPFDAGPLGNWHVLRKE
ncbi:hypothetical protein MVEN_01647900 [Mycena venus]|uniref:Uncharacterized protein n=1 Tax=Mycena venus TaxID=2733690 RepID=A0A8H7CQU3_9AGAR|nr:hypothetical protein MVEN_01647900 [Mycena venus]